MTDSDIAAANLLGALATGINDMMVHHMCLPLRVSPPESACLLAVHARPGSNISDVAASAGLSHSRAVRIVDALVASGRVTRRAGNDRRAVRLQVTDAGASLAGKLLSRRREVLTNAICALKPSDRQLFAVFARALLSTLPNDQAEAWRICRFCEHSVCRGEACPVGSAIEQDRGPNEINAA